VITEEYTEWEVLNKQKPIWMRKPEEVTQEEYNSFYKSVCSDWEDPLAVKHFVAEGQVEFRGLLFVPKRAPFEMFTRENRHNLKLYVRRVFISDKSDDMVPEWLNFVKGIVDSDDLPLNVSRELLQQSNSMRIIRKGVVKKCIELFQELARDRPEDYKTFYSHFHKNLKLGIHEDKNNNLSKLVELLRFYSSKSEQEYTTLQDYVQRMKEGQKNIYYITGESVLQVKNSPFLEKLRKRGFEVLYMVDAIDEYMLQKFQYYKDMKLVCITKEGTQIEGESEEEQKALKEEFKDTCAKIKEILADRVKDVTVSNRITESPAVLVAGEQSLSANMERILKAQAMQNNDQMSFLFMHKKTLEINPDHKLIKSLKERISKGEDISSVKDIVHMLFETSLLGSGFALDDPSKFIQRIYRMMTVGMSLEEDEVEQTEEVVVEEATPVISSRMEEVD
jgi:molecular chaperone HtpG